MMNKSIILLLLFLSVNTAYGKTITAYSINSENVTDILKKADSSTLVLISIDDIILTPKSKIFKYDSPYRSFISNIAKFSDKQPIFKNALSVWMTHRKLMLVEDDWPEFIDNLKKTGATVVGLVQTYPQIYQILKTPELSMYQELQGFKLNFTDKINKQELFKINSANNINSIFYKGIIFTGLLSKAETLVDFMKVTNNIPKKIIVLENRKDYIEQMERFIRVYNTEYYFINYLGLRNLKGSPDENLFKFQQQQLINEGKWLEDEEAEKLISAPKAPLNINP